MSTAEPHCACHKFALQNLELRAFAALCLVEHGASKSCQSPLQVAFGIEWDPAWVMELESDARHKFSRHLIIQIPGTAFANNLHVGHFVSQICSAAVDRDSGQSRLQVAKACPFCHLSPLEQSLLWPH